MLKLFFKKRSICKLFVSSVSYFKDPFGILGRKMSEKTVEDWKYIYIACPDKAVYFKKIEGSSENESESRLESKSNVLENGLEHVLLFPKCESGNTAMQLYVDSAISSMPVYRNQDFWTRGMLAHCVQFNNHFVKRGVYINTETESVKSVIEQILAENPCFEILHLVEQNPNDYKLTSMINNGQTSEEICVKHVNRPSQGPADAPTTDVDDVSPIFRTVKFMPVFHNFQRTKEILSLVSK